MLVECIADHRRCSELEPSHWKNHWKVNRFAKHFHPSFLKWFGLIHAGTFALHNDFSWTHFWSWLKVILFPKADNISVFHSECPVWGWVPLQNSRNWFMEVPCQVSWQGRATFKDRRLVIFSRLWEEDHVFFKSMLQMFSFYCISV